MKTYQCKEKGQQEVKAGRMEISKGRARVNKTAVILFFSFKIWSFQIVQTVWEADTHLISTTGLSHMPSLQVTNCRLLFPTVCGLLCLLFTASLCSYCFICTWWRECYGMGVCGCQGNWCLLIMWLPSEVTGWSVKCTELHSRLTFRLMQQSCSDGAWRCRWNPLWW